MVIFFGGLSRLHKRVNFKKENLRMDYEELSDIPVTYENKYGQLIKAIVVYCSYDFGITIINADTKTYLICLSRKSATSESAIEAYNMIFDYMYRIIKSNEVMKEYFINDISHIEDRTSDSMKEFCPFNQ